jgi:hypothetical protein
MNFPVKVVFYKVVPHEILGLMILSLMFFNLKKKGYGNFMRNKFKKIFFTFQTNKTHYDNVMKNEKLIEKFYFLLKKRTDKSINYQLIVFKRIKNFKTNK